MADHGNQRGQDNRDMDEAGEVPVKAAVGSFEEFAHWMDHELGRLVACWAHAAAPSASRLPLPRSRLTKQD